MHASENITVIIRSRDSVTWNIPAALCWSSLYDDGDVRIVFRSCDAARVWARPESWWRIIDSARRFAYAVKRAFVAADGSVRLDASRVNLHKREAKMIMRGPRNG